MKKTLKIFTRFINHKLQRIVQVVEPRLNNSKNSNNFNFGLLATDFYSLTSFDLLAAKKNFFCPIYTVLRYQYQPRDSSLRLEIELGSTRENQDPPVHSSYESLFLSMKAYEAGI